LSDADYEVMRREITEDRTPNLLALHYDVESWEVRSLILVPRFVFSLSCIEKRRPLGPLARRAGWVGCIIVLAQSPPDARIPVVTDGVPLSSVSVRRQYDRLRPLASLSHEMRGWTLDVLNIVRSLGRAEFTLAEVYAFAGELARRHPRNRFVQPKIRQQLQRLRDMGFVKFLGRGTYRLT
jgi:type II restriction enzyme